jgi:peptidoglycan/LPS O-acetylase OafA/YrhL
MKVRIEWIDSLRLFAILLIISAHISLYLNNQFFNTFFAYEVAFGLGLFIFLSGYSLYYNDSIDSFNDVKSFYKRRLSRIYGLYLIALFFFYLCFQHFKLYGIPVSYDKWGWLIHISGLQVLLSPGILQVPMFTLWFIGLILILYLLYPILAFPKNNKDIILISFIVFLIAFVLRVVFNIIEIRFFAYYFMFIAGMIFCRHPDFDIKKFLPLFFITLIFSVFIFGFLQSVSVSEYYVSENPGQVSFLIADTYLMLISFNIIMVYIMMIFSKVNIGAIKIFISSGAIASYCVYLFHWPVLALLVGVIDFLNIQNPLHDLFVIIVLIPLLFYISYIIQICYNTVMDKIRYITINTKTDVIY